MFKIDLTEINNKMYRNIFIYRNQFEDRFRTIVPRDSNFCITHNLSQPVSEMESHTVWKQSFEKLCLLSLSLNEFNSNET